jgi:hypothetical protein
MTSLISFSYWPSMRINGGSCLCLTSRNRVNEERGFQVDGSEAETIEAETIAAALPRRRIVGGIGAKRHAENLKSPALYGR